MAFEVHQRQFSARRNTITPVYTGGLQVVFVRILDNMGLDVTSGLLVYIRSGLVQILANDDIADLNSVVVTI